jgi:DNA-binding MurR/RpiR family transcriptional regulator
MKKTERRVVDFLVAHAAKVKRYGVVEVAKASACSDGTVVRVAKRLGYDGFLELRKDFGRNRPDEQEQAYTSINEGDSPLDILRKVSESTISGLKDTVKVIGESSSLDKAVEYLTRAKRILFCAMGDAQAVAYESYLRWMRVGYSALMAMDMDEQLLLVGQLEEDDVVVAISHSGKSRNVVNVAKTAKARKAKVIALTNYPVSPLVKQADLVLLTAVFTTYERFEIIAKRIAELTIMESLFISFIMHEKDRRLAQLFESYGRIEVNKI